MAKQSDGAVTVVVKRTFDAPAERVFDAWLDPANIGQWLFRTPTGELVKCELDPRAGGKFALTEKRGELLAEHFGEFRELDRPRRLTFTFATDHESAPTLVTVDIVPTGGGCEVTLTHRLDAKWAEYTERVQSGWAGILDGLDDTLFVAVQVVSSRVFDAPLAMVVRAFTDPEQLKHWWGPNGFTNTIHEFDPRPGGRWRYTMHGPDGTDYHNECVFAEVSDTRIVFDHLQPVHHFRMTMTFAEKDGKTTLTWRMRFDNAAELTKAKPYVVPGNEQNLERLAAHLKAK